MSGIGAPVELKVRQFWMDADERNADPEVNQTRVVQIVELPTRSKPGIMRVVQAPRNRKSEGQLRPFTEAKLRAHYMPIKENKPKEGEQ